MSLFVRKPMETLMLEASETGSHTLKRTLGPYSLVALGIGAIIGAGLFSITGLAAANNAGPAITISFIVAATGCLFAGLCYAEFASMIPVAGSAYTYSYATMGEFLAWIIGWDLVLEYAVGAATVGISWSRYLVKFLEGFDITLPHNLTVGPWDGGIINLPAVFIIVLMSSLLIKGTQESATVNGIIVFLKVSVVIVFITLGWKYINNANLNPYLIPANVPGHESFFEHGWGGIVRAAAIVFFAYIGFDAVSTASQEAKNPKKDMPIGILGSLAICTVLYILFSWVLTGVAPYQDFMRAGKEASVAYAISTYMIGYGWLSTLVTIAILLGFSSVILVMLLGQSRVFYTMSTDGLLPSVFSDLHPKFRTPYKSNMILFVFVGLFAAFLPETVAGDLTSIGTLFAFVLVCIGVMVLRKKEPTMVRPFKTPLVPLVPILGIIVCAAMILSLPGRTQLSALAWMVVGLIIYFAYSRKNSKIGTAGDI